MCDELTRRRVSSDTARCRLLTLDLACDDVDNVPALRYRLTIAAGTEQTHICTVEATYRFMSAHLIDVKHDDEVTCLTGRM
jgi:hypothetical protein